MQHRETKPTNSAGLVQVFFVFSPLFLMSFFSNLHAY